MRLSALAIAAAIVFVVTGCPRSPAPFGPGDVAATDTHATSTTIDRDRGRKLFKTHGCGGCHGTSAIASSVTGMYGAQLVLTDGRTVVVDEGYIQRAILEPIAEVPIGAKAGAMPSYGAVLSPEDVAAIVRLYKDEAR